VPPEPSEPRAPASPTIPAATNEPIVTAPVPPPLEPNPPEPKPLVTVAEPPRSLADPLEARGAATTREAPQARAQEGKVIPFPARREDELPQPEAAPVVAAPPPLPAEEEPPISAAPNTPPMPHVLAAHLGTPPVVAAPPPSKVEPPRSVEPAQPTAREPALDRRREREAALGQTLSLGSGLPHELSPESNSVAAASEAVVSGSTQRFGSNGAAEPLETRTAVSPTLEAPIATLKAQDSDKHAALHDDFFDAGEQGLYDAGEGPAVHQLVDDELEPDLPRSVRRTPEQERRRNKMMQVVGLVVGSVLGVLIFAVLARGRSSHVEPPKQDAPARVSDQLEATPPPAPPTVTPPPPPTDVVEAPPTNVDGAASSGTPANPGGAPGASRPADLSGRPRGVGEPATPTQPRRPLLPLPAGKPPTASFPD